jgi:triosephosphate isomerase
MYILPYTISTVGSVNGANCKELAAQPDVDGFLVGGASLKVIICVYVIAFTSLVSCLDLG